MLCDLGTLALSEPVLRRMRKIWGHLYHGKGSYQYVSALRAGRAATESPRKGFLMLRAFI